MTFMKHLTCIKSDVIFKDLRYVHYLYLQKADRVYQITTLNEFINKSVYTVIWRLTCDPISYHLQGVSPSFTRTISGQLLIGLAGVNPCNIIVRGSHPDNNEQFSFILLSFSLLLRTK